MNGFDTGLNVIRLKQKVFLVNLQTNNIMPRNWQNCFIFVQRTYCYFYGWSWC